MNRQSDFGYSTSPNEDRTVALCVQRARLSKKLGRRDWARQWIAEGRARRAADIRRAVR